MRARRRLRSIIWTCAYIIVLFIIFLYGAEYALRYFYSPEVDVIDHGSYLREQATPPEWPEQFQRITYPSFTVDQTLYGCRHPGDPEDVLLSEGNIEFLFIGDSFTYGWGVENDQTFGARFAAYAGARDRTLVCGGFAKGSRFHIGQLQRVLSKEHSVKVVFYQLFGNDIMSDILQESDDDEETVEKLFSLSWFYRVKTTLLDHFYYFSTTSRIMS